MAKLFISHSSADDAFVRELRRTLADLKQEVWIDSRELRGGDPLWPEIQKAIDESSAVAVVASPNSLQSEWVGKELRHALDVQQQRGRLQFPVFVLSLDGAKLGVLQTLFADEPLYIPVTHGNQLAVVDELGRPLVRTEFSAAGELEDAIQEVERALREQSTLLVVDNMESVLLPPYLETPEVLSEEAGRESQAIRALCERLLKVGDTRLP